MKKRFYIDTCIYLNLWKKEGNPGHGKFYWELAQEFFDKNEDDSIFFFSGFVLRELEHNLTKEIYEQKIVIFRFNPKFKQIIASSEDVDCAREIESDLNYEISFFDIFHLILSRKEDAILITRDKKLLETAKKLGIKAGKPENFL
jgi:hypothetical protein